MKNFKHTIYHSSAIFMALVAVCICSTFICTNVNAAVRLNKTKATVNVGDTFKLKATDSNGSIKWSSSKKKVASVSNSGLVTPKKKGTTTITAKIDGKRLKCKVTVRPIYTISKKSKLMNVGSNLYSTYSSAYVNSYTRDWYLFRSYLEKLQALGGGTLIVKKGTYNITNTICIPSNVNIIFKNGVVINKTTNTHTKKFHAGTTLFEFVPSNKYNKKDWCSKYNGVHNSKIIGKGNVKIDLKNVLYSVGFTLCHNKNIEISGISFANVNESHFIELDASQNVKISNCAFSNAKGENTNREAINIDTPDTQTGGFSKPWAKNDKTPNIDVTISNCNFSKLYVAVGTHQYSMSGSKNIYHENIVIKNCTLDKIEQYGFSALNWKNSTFSNNIISNIDEIGIYAAGVVNPLITGNKFSSVNIGIKLTHTTRGGYDTVYTEISDRLFETANTKNIFIKVESPVIADND